jgi:hypothetical protein
MEVMMRALLTIAAALLLTACAPQPATPDTTTTPEPSATESRSQEKTYTMNGTLVSRDPAKNTINVDNEDVPGVMPPMKMDYELRGATVDTLPPDGARVTMNLHEQDGTYWVTDVRTR